MIDVISVFIELERVTSIVVWVHLNALLPAVVAGLPTTYRHDPIFVLKIV